MAAVYKQFLAAPSSSLLADDASLHYVTTTTSVSGAGDILKHLLALHGQVNKKSEQVVHAVEGAAAIAVEMDTCLHFQTSGGVYLPGIDDNFLANETAQLLIMHIVTFDGEGKISRIRQQWDQGSLLKQMGLIGKTGRNWPIRDSKDQLALVQSCLKASPGGPAARANGHADPSPNKPRAGVPNAMRDPHASLHLFATREEREAMQFAPVPSPYAGQRPKQRAPTDFLTDMPQCGEADPYRSSPSKAGLKEVQPIRIFDGHNDDVDSDEDEKPKSKLPHITAHPAKYEHFHFHDGPNPNSNPSAAAPVQTPKGMQSPYSQSTSKLSFEDYSSAPVKAVPMKGMRNLDLGSVEDPAALGNITNTSTNGRATNTKNIEPNFALSDKPPSKDATQTLIDAVRAMDISESAVPRKNLAENDRQHAQEPRIHVAGDGMGGRRGAARDFLFGGNDDVQPHRPLMARKTGPSSSQSSLWDM